MIVAARLPSFSSSATPTVVVASQISTKSRLFIRQLCRPRRGRRAPSASTGRDMAKGTGFTDEEKRGIGMCLTPPPEPPEKPLPGDCCGSGCVRCVWDVYYDELEEYNKLLAAFKKQETEADRSN